MGGRAVPRLEKLRQKAQVLPKPKTPSGPDPVVEFITEALIFFSEVKDANPELASRCDAFSKACDGLLKENQVAKERVGKLEEAITWAENHDKNLSRAIRKRANSKQSEGVTP